MKRPLGFIKTVALMACFLYLGGMTVPAFVPKAQALFWEDDYGGNDPKERVKRPGGFFLFNWISKLARKSEERQYSKIEGRDTGPSVNNRRRSTLVVTCGLVGLGTGLLIAHFGTKDDENRTSNMFIGGALGLGTGVLVAALIMPRDYQVDPAACTDFLKHRQAWLQDESSRTIRSAFHPAIPLVRAQF
jgi:hypothetical protein